MYRSVFGTSSNSFHFILHHETHLSSFCYKTMCQSASRPKPSPFNPVSYRGRNNLNISTSKAPSLTPSPLFLSNRPVKRASPSIIRGQDSYHSTSSPFLTTNALLTMLTPQVHLQTLLIKFIPPLQHSPRNISDSLLAQSICHFRPPSRLLCFLHRPFRISSLGDCFNHISP